MQRYEAIESGIANNDVNALREAIGSICYTCGDFSDHEFDAVVEYVERRGIKIKDDMLIGNPVISSQKASFTDEDFARAVFELKKNFCDERIADVKKIGKILYGTQKAAQGKNTINNAPYISKTMNTGTNPNFNSHQQKSSKTPVAIGVVAVLVIILIILLVLNG